MEKYPRTNAPLKFQLANVYIEPISNLLARISSPVNLHIMRVVVEYVFTAILSYVVIITAAVVEEDTISVILVYIIISSSLRAWDARQFFYTVLSSHKSNNKSFL